MNQFEKHTHELSSQAFLEAITNFSPSFVSVLDTGGIIQFVNRTPFDLPKERVLGSCLFDYLNDKKESDKLKDCFDTVIQTRQPKPVEIVTAVAKKTPIIWECRVSPIIESDLVTGLVLFTNDITQRRATEFEQQAVFDLSEEFWCILKFDGYLARVNPAFTTKLGYSEAELLDIPFRELIHPDDRAGTLKAFAASKNTDEQPSSIENRYLAKDGRVVSIKWDGRLDVEAQRFIAVGKDVTENRSLEQQLGHAQKMDAIGHLAGGVAHDFNNLLMAITANSELGMMSEDIAEVKRRLTDIESAALKAAELTQKLLTFSRNQPSHKKNLDLNSLIKSFIKLLERVIPENVELIFEPDPEISKVYGDPVQLEQVIMNLCVNARDSIKGAGTIWITTRRLIKSEKDSEEEQVCLQVRDSGSGIPSELLDKVFNPFFTTKQEGKGTGLGLSTAYGIVKKHNGTINIEQTGVGGTIMRITLSSQNIEAEAIVEQQRSIPLVGSETILVAEDEELVASATTNILKKAGYRVILASNGIEAVQICSERDDIDLLFMDVIMPKMDGPDAAAEIKKTRPELPIVFASGYSPETHRELVEQYPILNKPYRSEELLSSIRSVLDKD